MRVFFLASLIRMLVASVALEQSQGYLHEDLPNEVFLDLCLLALVVLDQLSEVTAPAVLLDDVKGGVSLVDDLVEAADDVLVTESAQDVELVDELAYFLLLELAVVDLLPDHLLARLEVPHERNLAKCALANVFLQNFVLFHP